MIFLRMNAFLALAASSSTVAAFQPNVSRFNSNSPPLHLNLNLHLHHSAHQRTRSAKAMTFTSALRMSKRSEDDDDEDDDYIDDADLGDWRSFRKTLVDSNFSDEQSDQTTDGFIGEGVDNSDIGDISDIKSSSQDTPAKEKRPKSVSKANEELLKTQSESLAKEYVNGIWAHVSSFAEIGGLVVRLPLEAEIYRSREKLTIGKELKQRLETNDTDKTSDNKPLLSNNDDSSTNINPDLSFSLTAAQTLLWFRKSQTLIDEHMADIAALADDSGQIDPRQLDPGAESLLKIYLDNQESWQEVGLVAERNEMNGSAVTYVLNRPMAFRLTENLARMLLFGATSTMDDGGVAISEMNWYTKFLRAFESSCAVYIGGPDHMEKMAVIIHGISDLEGATEISPGTGIYRGGMEAAVEGILEGRFNPLDFRFFIGCHDYKDGDLDVKIYSNKYQPIACTRALALKQCIQLPKPLWHEVMELCGGELREMSRLELMKRDDIQE